MFRKGKAKKGLSGAVTALILVIASVIIALVVVGFAFGLFGAFGGTPTVTQVGTGIIFVNNGTAVITLHSTGNVKIVSASIVGTVFTATGSEISGATLNAGQNVVMISFPTVVASTTLSSYLQPGAPYTISIALSDGQTVQVSVTAQ